MRELIEPQETLIRIDLDAAHKSAYLRDLERAGDGCFGDGITDATRFLMSLGLASKSDYLELKDLNHNNGKESFTMPTPYLCLCTVVPVDASTGATITEATGATGYARKKIEAANLGAASAGSQTNTAELVFPAITAGSATVIGWCTNDSATTGAGNNLYWGTCTSTAISTMATPPTIAVGGYVTNED